MCAPSALKKSSVVISLCCLGILCAGQNTSGPEATVDETELANATIVKKKIQSIVQATLKEGEFTTVNGIKATTRVPPSAERIEEVKQLGKSAVPVLAAYASS